jgi:2-methylaconitate cis-trans-isomerase PrpF
MSFGQTRIPGVYLRGGSSKALFLKEHDIPPPGPLRDVVLKRLMGSPDPIQIDGMGGTRVITSKIAIVKTSEREDADVDYTFVQVGINTSQIGYGSNCGNISSGVGPFAIDEGLIKKPFREGVAVESGILTREVRIWQTGTKKLLIAHVPVDEKSGRSISRGEFAIAAVPGTGAPILMDFRNVMCRFQFMNLKF